MDKKRLLLTVIAISAVYIAAGLIITLNILVNRRNSEVVSYIRDNFAAYAKMQTAGIDMSPMLSEMLDNAEVVSAHLNDKKDAVDVTFTLPGFDLRNAVSGLGAYDPEAAGRDPVKFISEAGERYAASCQTQSEHRHAITIPLRATGFNLQFDMSGQEFLDIFRQYSAGLRAELEKFIALTNIGDALADYLIPAPFADPQSAIRSLQSVQWGTQTGNADGELDGLDNLPSFSPLYSEYCHDIAGIFAQRGISRFGIADAGLDDIARLLQARLSPGFHTAKLELKVGEHGKVYIELYGYDITRIIDYAAQESYEAYAGRFLTDEVTQEMLELGFFPQVFMLSHGLSSNSEISQPDDIRVSADATREVYMFDLGKALPAASMIRFQMLSGIGDYLEYYGDAVAALKEHTNTLPLHMPLPEPDSGVLAGASAGLHLTIENPLGYGSCYLVFMPVPADAYTAAPISSISSFKADSPDAEGYLHVYVREGDIYTVRLPAGTYNMVYAHGSGSAWYGQEHLFGNTGRYLSSENPVTLKSGSYTLTLNASDNIGTVVGEKEIPYEQTSEISPPGGTADGVSARFRSADQLKARLLGGSDGKLPYLIYVSKNSFTIAILGLDDKGEHTRLLHTFHTAVGRTSGQTRAGNYTIISRERRHWWTGSSYSPFATRHSGGLWFHGPIFEGNPNSMRATSYNEIGTRATSGCMRTYTSAAAWIYDNCANGTKVVIANDSKYASIPRAPVDPLQRYDPTDPDIMIG